MAQREYAAGVDGVVADPVVTVVERGAGRDRFGPGIVGLLGGAPAKSTVGSHGVVIGAEGIKLALQLSHGAGFGLCGEPFLKGLMEPFDLAAGLWVIRAGVPKADAAVVEGDLQGDASAATATAGEHGPVVRQHAGADHRS